MFNNETECSLWEVTLTIIFICFILDINKLSHTNSKEAKQSSR